MILQLIKRISLYGRLIKLLYILNVLSLAVGLVAAVHYGFKAHSAAQKVQELQSKSSVYHRISEKAVRVLDDANSKDAYVKRRNQEVLLEDIKQALPMTVPESLSSATPITAEHIADILTRTNSEIEKNSAQISALVQSDAALTLQLAVIAGLTFLFGFLLPAWISKKLTVAVLDMKKDVEVSVGKWIAEYSKEYSNHPEPFKNPNFWLNIIALSVEISSRYWSHPASGIIQELGPIIRAELQKIQPEPPHGGGDHPTRQGEKTKPPTGKSAA